MDSRRSSIAAAFSFGSVGELVDVELERVRARLLEQAGVASQPPAVRPLSEAITGTAPPP